MLRALAIVFALDGLRLGVAHVVLAGTRPTSGRLRPPSAPAESRHPPSPRPTWTDGTILALDEDRWLTVTFEVRGRRSGSKNAGKAVAALHPQVMTMSASHTACVCVCVYICLCVCMLDLRNRQVYRFACLRPCTHVGHNGAERLHSHESALLRSRTVNQQILSTQAERNTKHAGPDSAAGSGSQRSARSRSSYGSEDSYGSSQSLRS